MTASRIALSLCSLLLVLQNAVGEVPDVEIKTEERNILKRHLLIQSKVSIANFYVNPQNGDIVFTDKISRDDQIYKLKVLKAGTEEPYEIEGYEGMPQAITADVDNDVIYFSTDKGIYKISRGSELAELFAQGGNDIHYVLFANKALYFIPHQQFQPYKYIWMDGVLKPEAIQLSTIVTDNRLNFDKEENMYYVDGTERLWKLSNGTSEGKIISFGDNDSIIYDTTVDVDDRLLFSSGNEIYTVKKGEQKAALLLTAQNEVESLYTDNDLDIYTLEGNTIYKYYSANKTA